MEKRSVPHKWRGLESAIAKMVASGELDPYTERDVIKLKMENRNPTLGPIARGTMQAVFKKLTLAGVLKEPFEGTLHIETPKYEGFLFDGDSLIVTIGNKTWAFTQDEFSKISHMFGKLQGWVK